MKPIKKNSYYIEINGSEKNETQAFQLKKDCPGIKKSISNDVAQCVAFTTWFHQIELFRLKTFIIPTQLIFVNIGSENLFQ